MLFWHDFITPTDSYAAEKTLLAITFLLGLTPLRIRGPNGKRLMTISRLGYAITIVQGIFFVYCFIHSFILDESIVGFFFKTEISKIGDILQKFIGLSGMLILFGVSLRKSSDMIAMYHTVAFIDGRFLNLGVEFNYRYIMKFRHSKLVMVTSVCVGYLASSLWMLFHNQIWPSFQAVIAFFVPHIFLLSVVVLNVSFLMRFWQHFDLLNKLTRHPDKQYQVFSVCERLRIMAVWNILPSSVRILSHDLHKPGDVYACYRVFFLYAFCIGIIPFQFYSLPIRHLKNTFVGYLNVIMRIGFYCYIFCISMIKEQSLLSQFYVTEVSRFTDSLQKFNGMFGIIIILALGLLKRKYLIKVMQQYEWLELHFSRIGIQFVQKRCARQINALLTAMCCANLGFILFGKLMIFERNEVYVSWVALLTFYSPNFINSSVVVMFGTTLHKMTIYLNALNKVLKNLCHQWDTRTIKAITQKQRSLQCLDSFSMYTIVSKNPAEIIQESMEIHQLICEAASTANKYFTYQLLTIISIAFLIIVFDAYYVLETLLGKSKRESKFKTVEFVTFFSCQMILYLIAIISIVEGSNRAIKKSEKTGGIVHALLNKAKSPEVKEKLQQFSMQLMHLKINFTAAGLFNIDRTLYFTISGALTTYLIILLQFTSNSPTILHNGCNTSNTSLAVLANHTQT